MDRIRMSRLLTRHLRHRPGEIGLVLDAGGWTGVQELLAALNRHGVTLARAELERIVAEDDKGRYTLDPSGRRIRANQGHSVPVELGLPFSDPPDRLYHGTVAAALAAIRRRGLRPMSRHDVHLSPDTATAERVAARRGTPVVLTVDAAAMSAHGHRFRVTVNGVWLAPHVPAAYLAGLEPSR